MVNNNIRCICVKPDGKRCKNKRDAGKELCVVHSKKENIPPFKLNNMFDDGEMEPPVPLEEPGASPIDEMSEMIASLTAQFEKENTMLREKITILESNRMDGDQDGEPRKQRRHNARNFTNQAKMMFYHEKKDTKEVRRVLREKLIIVDLYQNDDRIPWTLVKQWTDRMFDELVDAEMNMYVEMVKYKNTNKQKHGA